MGFDWRVIEAELASLLASLGAVRIDRDRVEYFARQIAGGRLGPGSNQLPGVPEPVAREGIDRLEALSSGTRDRAARLGREAIARGEVAVAVLNGGMATRFGGAVKGIVEVFDGRSFLEIKLEQALAQGPAPFVIMNSFATHRPTLEFLERRGLAARALPFLQDVSLRLTPQGELLRDAAGALSPYAPGHGDFVDALMDSGTLDRLRERGVRCLLLSNVDNLGAELDPLVIGYHLQHGRPLTVELAEARPDDVGGTVVRWAGCLQLVEGFRFPPGFDWKRVRYLNTNTFVLSLEVLERRYPFSWFYVEKNVAGLKAVQMERLMGELSAFVPSAFLASAREGPSGRFLPVKTPEDLDRMRGDPALRERFGRR
ncbi:MAG: UTP--glucose-1-phosphate uridylyltransferase [Myxococcota bacterium]